MEVLLRLENFEIRKYMLCFMADSLALKNENYQNDFIIPYEAIEDFCVTENQTGKALFTMMANGIIYEGSLQNNHNIRKFSNELKNRLGGIINTEVKKI